MAEVVLTSAYVIERADGELAAWNCTAARDAGGISVQAAEETIRRVHLNLNRPQQVKAEFANAAAVLVDAKGMLWIGPGGEPELIR